MERNQVNEKPIFEGEFEDDLGLLTEWAEEKQVLSYYELKRCSSCFTIAPFHEFNNRTKSPDGKHPRCRNCNVQDSIERRTRKGST